MKRKRYRDSLRDPRWQRKRLGVFERAGWKCVGCESDRVELQVHHLQYLDGEPWDVPDEWLESLCRDCHQWREHWNALFGRSLTPTSVLRKIPGTVEEAGVRVLFDALRDVPYQARRKYTIVVSLTRREVVDP